MKNSNIPKKIHYCWFGGKEIPPTVKRCIDSWKRVCPDYEIIRWDETNYKVNEKCEFVRNAYSAKMWAFVSDYARLDIIYIYGGIYLDTDVELLKSLDDLLEIGKGFFGFETEKFINTGLGFACEKNEKILLEMLNEYENISFDRQKKEFIACPTINTKILKKYGLILNNQFQYINGIAVLPTEYLCPENIYTGQKEYTDKTVSVHHYDASWLKGTQAWKNKLIIKIKRMIPNTWVEKIRRAFRKHHADESY